MKDDESFVAVVLGELGFRPKRFEKHELRQGLKTPDFRVYTKGDFAFFCEVKTFTDPTGFYDTLSSAPSCTVVEEMQKDSTKSNRLVNRLADSIKKFKDVNPSHNVPNVVAIVNRDEMFFPDDIVELFRGYAFVVNRTKCHTIPEICRDRFAEGRDWIDAFLILHRVKETGEKYNMLYYQQEALACHPVLQALLERYKEWDGQQTNAGREYAR